jgi:ribosome biogenesis GTPase A
LVAFKLALLNLISPQSYELEETARAGLKLIGELYPVQLREKLGNSEAASSLESFAHCRRLLKSGGNLDIMRAASLFLQELRNAKLGRITLDREDIACR